MSTAVYDAPVVTEQADVAITEPADLQERYRQSVLDGRESVELCEAAAKTLAEWWRDRRTYISRVDAANTLAEVVPVLEAAAKEAGEAAARGAPVVTDETTIGTIRERIAAIQPGLATDTPAGLSRGLLLLAEAPQRLKQAARTARDRATETRHEAERLLFQTCGDVPSTPEENGIQQQVGQVQGRVNERQAVLAAEGQVPLIRNRIRRITTGELTATSREEWEKQGWIGGAPTSEWERTETKNMLTRAKAKLQQLLTLAKGKRQAERDNAADLAELQRLNERLGQLEEARRERMREPLNMHWSE